jgi:uncharacterized membrane protein YhaH (DUF805 family)
MKWFLFCMRRYARFIGRGSRAEFWWFWLTSLILSLLLMLAAHLAPQVGKALQYVWSIVGFTPILAATSRRLHDSGHSFWWAGTWYLGTALIVLSGWVVIWLKVPPTHSLAVSLLGLCYFLAWFGLFFRLLYLLAVRGDDAVNRYGQPVATKSA